MVEVLVLTSWLTPTSLFVVLNIVLATIFINHNSKNNHHNNHHSTTTTTDTPTPTTTITHSQPHPQLMRAPSLFSRVASFNFSHYYHSQQDSHNMSPPPDTVASVVAPPVVETVTRAPSLLFRVASFKLGWTSPQLQQDQVDEHASVNEQVKKEARVVENEGHVRREKAVEEEVKVKVVSKKKKVVKKKEKMSADVAKLEKKTTAFKKVEEEVDTKADDFINKFKQQLKMQRLESLLRYRNATPSA